jgi:hypothetical protein
VPYLCGESDFISLIKSQSPYSIVLFEVDGDLEAKQNCNSVSDENIELYNLLEIMKSKM